MVMKTYRVLETLQVHEGRSVCSPPFADLLVGLAWDLKVEPIRFGDPHGNENLQGFGDLAG